MSKDGAFRAARPAVGSGDARRTFEPLESRLLLSAASAEPLVLAVDANSLFEVWVDDDAVDTPDGSAEYPFARIQDAIDAATSGGTVHVLAGTYGEHLGIGQSLTLLGEDPETTIIDAGGTAKGIWITDGDWTVVIDGFTVTGAGAGQTGSKINAGIVAGGAQVDIRRTRVVSNLTWGVVFETSGSFRDSLVTGNTGGFQAGIGADVDIQFSTIVDNTNGVIIDPQALRVGVGNSIVALNDSMGILMYDFGPGWDYPSLTIDYNLVYGNPSGNYSNVSPGANDAATPATFVDADGGNYRLQVSSAGFDAGDRTAVLTGETDLDGHLRISGFGVDIGAYELEFTPVDVPYEQNFSSGLPGREDGWQYYSTKTGRIGIADGMLQMDDLMSNDVASLNEAILHVNLASAVGVTLTFSHTSAGDENDGMPDTFTGHVNADGVAVSGDGITWYKLIDLTTSFTDRTFDLDAFMLASGFAYGQDVQIKFQQYDNSPWLLDGRAFDNFTIALVEPGIQVVTTTGDLHRTAEQVYAVRWQEADSSQYDSDDRVQLFFNTDPTWDPTAATANDLDAHRLHELADLPVGGSLARLARNDGTIDDGLWVRLEGLSTSAGNYVFAAVVDESTGDILTWNRSGGRLIIDLPLAAAGQVLTTRLPGGFNKSVDEAADQDPNGKGTYVIRWSDAGLPAGATIDIKFGASATFSEATTQYAYGWGAGTSGGTDRGNIARRIVAATDGPAGDSFKWYIGDSTRVARGVGYYMWVVIRGSAGDILATARSIGQLTIIP